MQPTLDPDPEEEDWASLPGPPKRGASPLRQAAGQFGRFLWNPVPVPRPQIDEDLASLSWPERSVEVIGFAVFSVEHWLSRGGVLREWLRLNLWLAVLLTLAAVLVVPPVTALLEGAAEWSSLGGEIVENITSSILRLPPVVLAIATLLLVIKVGQRHWQRRRSRASYETENYPYQ